MGERRHRSVTEGTSVASQRLGLTLRRWWRRRLAEFGLRWCGDHTGNTLAGLERARTVRIGTLTITFLYLFGHVAARPGVRRAFAVRAVHMLGSPSAVSQASFYAPASLRRRHSLKRLVPITLWLFDTLLQGLDHHTNRSTLHAPCLHSCSENAILGSRTLFGSTDTIRFHQSVPATLARLLSVCLIAFPFFLLVPKR